MHVKILRFMTKIFLIGLVLEEVRFFRVVLRLRGMEKIFKLGQKKFFSLKSYMTLKYLLIIDFPKFNPLTAAEVALCIYHASEFQN